MIHGLDTGFLVAVEVAEHQSHAAARTKLAELIASGDTLAIAPQILAEFLHVVTDPKRFGNPLEMSAAIGLAEHWWTARDVVPVFPNDLAVRQQLAWMRQHFLGRKRLLDTLLAATYWQAGVTSLLTTNPKDFTIFGCFQCVTP
jgi:predicted nucleic acid-binding protein